MARERTLLIDASNLATCARNYYTLDGQMFHRTFHIQKKQKTRYCCGPKRMHNDLILNEPAQNPDCFAWMLRAQSSVRQRTRLFCTQGHENRAWMLGHLANCAQTSAHQLK